MSEEWRAQEDGDFFFFVLGRKNRVVVEGLSQEDAEQVVRDHNHAAQIQESDRAERAILSSAEAYRLVEEARQMRAERDAHAAQVQELRAENDLLGNVLHTLVCNAYGYDKSIVRALALAARQYNPELAQRVLDAENAAGRVSHCSDFHTEAALDSTPAGATGDGHPDWCRAVHESGRRCEREAGHTQADPRHYALGMSTAWTDAAPTA